jgi:hypothetical protein
MDSIILNNDYEFSQDEYLNKDITDNELNLNTFSVDSETSIIYINTEE